MGKTGFKAFQNSKSFEALENQRFSKAQTLSKIVDF
jgi:hypothetical protein